MRTDDFDYALPPDSIAQTPLPRGESRMLVLERQSGRILHRAFHDLVEYLRPDDTLVINDTRVIARRLVGKKESGLECEALLLRPVGVSDWEALVRPGKRLKPGSQIQFILGNGDLIQTTIIGTTAQGGRILRFADSHLRDRMNTEGAAPLPPYIDATLSDEERYQTVYSKQKGSAAAPTAGLHFTDSILGEIRGVGVRVAEVTLHVGVDTFRPVKTEYLEDHELHGEWVQISQEACETVNSTGGKVFAVGTTSVRALESAAIGPHCVAPFEGDTRLFITPGYRFQIVDALLTNFHLPKSTLLALVSAFAGRGKVLAAYQSAIEQKYRFFSFGDAMLIV